MEQVKKKLLCIEDDRETAALLEEVLIERGFAVSLAYNGYEGMETLFREQPDLVLCDINMPIMSRFRSVGAADGNRATIRRYAIHLSDRTGGAR